MTTHDAPRSTLLAAAIALACGTSAAGAATITVTDGGDAGTGSTCTLRQAIAAANGDGAVGACAAGSGADQIVFASALVNATITLSQGQLSVTAPLAINGNGQTIDAAGASRVLYVQGTSLAASSLTLTGGVATVSPNTFGGGVYLFGSAGLQMSACHITGNSAFYGGGVAVRGDSTATLSNCVVSGNTSAGGFAQGGGIFVQYSTATFVHTTIAGNAAARGAGVFSSHGSTTFIDSAVTGNSATINFGGVYGIYSTLTLANTTVYQNSAANFGGGVFVPRSLATLVNATVSGNSASTSPGVGGQVSGGSAVNTITLYNSIVANNPGGDCYDGAGTTTIIAKNTLIGDSGSPCGITNGTDGNITGQDPLLGALADHGGATKTMAPGALSPALDAGSLGLAAFNSVPLQYDQRGFGFPRTLDGKIDIGAFQHQGSRVFADGLEAEP